MPRRCCRCHTPQIPEVLGAPSLYPARDSASTPTTFPQEYRKRWHTIVNEDSFLLESRQRLEERIQQVLAERAVVRELLFEEKNEKNAALVMREEEPEPEVELFPISASVIPIRKAPVQSAFVLPAFEVPRSYASNRR